MSLTVSIITGMGAVVASDTRVTTMSAPDGEVVSTRDGDDKVGRIPDGWAVGTGLQEACRVALEALAELEPWDMQKAWEIVVDTQAAESPRWPIMVSVVRREGARFALYLIRSDEPPDVVRVSQPNQLQMFATWPRVTLTKEERQEQYDRPFIQRLKGGRGFDHVLLARTAEFFYIVNRSGITEMVGPECNMGVLTADGEFQVTHEAGALANVLGHSPTILEMIKGASGFTPPADVFAKLG